MALTTREAFKKLVTDKELCEDIGINESTRRTYLKRLNDNDKISLDKIEELLEKAGFTVKQEKLWI